MLAHDYLSLAAVVIVLGYYAVVWFRYGRDPKPGVIVARYEPPEAMSPAMLRYIWKQNLDARVFWAAALSLISKGLATLYDKDGQTLLRPVEHVQPSERLPSEEARLYTAVSAHSNRKPLVLSLVNEETQFIAEDLCDQLRKKAGERWFCENRRYVQIGAMISFAGVALAAAPHTPEEYIALALVFGLTAPAAYYLFFLVLSTFGILRTASTRQGVQQWKRLVRFLLLIVPCVASIAIGSLILAYDYGTAVLVAALALIVVNLSFLRLMRAPTAAGRIVLDQIEGFREFLASVERHPMDQGEEPSTRQGLYERYLPYAVALEVEQHWADRFVLTASTDSRAVAAAHAKIFDLGMWNGRVIEIAIGPPNKGSSFR